MKLAMTRIDNYRKRITSLKEERLDLLHDLNVNMTLLNGLHKDSFMYDQALTAIEVDLANTDRLLATFEYMKALW
jgi:hypothetical protein